MLAVISLTTPLMLWGLGLLTLPIAAHLLNRHVRRRIIFPTIRLLRESAATQSRLFKLRRWILLALRCLAVALIAWAFARPVWTNAGEPKPSSGTSTGVILLIDCSASSEQQSGGVALFSSIRSAAQRTLDSLKSGVDVADIVLANAQPEAVFGRLSPNIPALRTKLQELNPTAERADISGGIALAGRMLAQHDGPRRLVILSDLQSTNWMDLDDQKSIGQLLPRDTRITFVRIDAPPPGNIGVSNARSFPPTPVINHLISLAVQVGNFADQEAQVRLEMSIDDLSAVVQTVTLGPREQREASFEATFGKAGQHRIVFSTSPDALNVDNRVFMVVDVVEHMPVVLVADDDVNEPGSSSYFMERALAPRDDQADQLEVKRLGSDQVTGAALSGASAVVVSDIGALRPAAASALVEYARGGGGIAWFCGGGPVGQNLAMVDQLGGPSGLLPFMPGTRRDLASAGSALTIGSGAWQSRMLQAFDERSQVALSQIIFRRVLSIGELRADARTLLSFNDGTPALAARTVGSGQFMLANFSPSLASSDLGRYGAFVALMQSLVNDLQPQRDERKILLVGEPYEFSPIGANATSRIEVIGPDGQAVAAESTTQNGKLVVSVARPSEPGFYQLQPNSQAISTAAINIDSRESDLRRADEAVLARQLEAGGNGGAAPEFNELNQSGPIVQLRGQPMWNWFIAAAMGALALELLMLGVWRR